MKILSFFFFFCMILHFSVVWRKIEGWKLELGTGFKKWKQSYIKQRRVLFKVTVYLQIANVLQIWSFRLKLLPFWPEVRIARLIDINYFTWRGHFKGLKLKGNLSVCPKIWTVARLTYKRQKSVCEFLFRNAFFSESDFCTITSHFFNTISKMCYHFLL